MMQSYVDNGQIAPLILFYSGPAHWNFTNRLSSFYGTGYTPSFFADHTFAQAGWNQAACENAINSRLAAPAYLSIEVSLYGDENSGMVNYWITAEQDLEPGGMIRLFSALTEDDIQAGPAWGVYNGITVNWIPRMSPLGVNGLELEFTGPYPQTIMHTAEYEIDSGWNFDKMGIVSFVIDYSGYGVYNASYEDDLGSIMGIEGSGSSLAMTVGPNPSNGAFRAFCSLPDGVSGTVEVFDVSGRLVGTAPATDAEFSVEETGLYLARLTSSEGEMVTSSLVVVR